MTYASFIEPNRDPAAGRLVTPMGAARHNLEMAADLDRAADQVVQQAVAALAGAKIAKQQAREDLKKAALAAVEQEFTEVETARLAGVTRMTIRDWLGKR